MKKILCLGLGLWILGIIGCDKFATDEEISCAIKEIEKENTVMGERVGLGDEEPPQAYLTFRNKISNNKLKELTKHPNAVVRCCAIQALSAKDKINLLPLILEHLDDTTTVTTFFGCIRDKQKVGDLFIDMSWNKLDKKQCEKLIHTLLFTPNELNAASWVLLVVEPKEGYYPRIKELVAKNQYQTAIVALAKFKREQDLKTILDNQKNSLLYTYGAIYYFPHPFFMGFLKEQLPKHLAEERWDQEIRQYYKAVAAYQNTGSLDILRAPLTQLIPMRQYHIDFVFEAVSEYQIDLYDPLLFDIWNSENKINLKAFDYLWKKYPDKSLKILPSSLRKADLLQPYIHRTDVIEKMLDMLAEKDKKSAIGIINQNLLDVNVNVFPVFSQKAALIQDKSFIEPLFERLEKEWNAHVYLEVVKTILSYNRKDLNERILQIMEKNQSLKNDWGGKELDKLLREKGVLK
ncbi:MAG: hypothetical protein HZA49_02315 [Planctomycetes bacterium]|nr:hypothetical protein [Planctomycetota bacterium]